MEILSRTFKPWDLRVGLKHQTTFPVTEKIIREFAELSGDMNPLHTDIGFGKSLGNKSIVAHGAIQQMFISRIAGMFLPGTYCVIKKVETDYLAPVFPESALIVESEVIKWEIDKYDGELSVKMRFESTNQLVSLSRVRFSLTYPMSDGMGKADEGSQTEAARPAAGDSSKPGILLIGGSGGIGRKLVEKLPGFQAFSTSRSDGADFRFDPETDPKEKLISYCQESGIYGIVHLASKMPMKAAPSSLDIADMCQNLMVHLRPLRDLCAAKKNGKLPTLARIIVFGSSWSREHFFEYGFESYGYVKLICKKFVQDLSREMAKTERFTINMVSPSELPVGMNSSLNERSLSLLGAKLPTGKTTTMDEVSSAIELLLAEKSEIIKGQEILIAGAKVK